MNRRNKAGIISGIGCLVAIALFVFIIGTFKLWSVLVYLLLLIWLVGAVAQK